MRVELRYHRTVNVENLQALSFLYGSRVTAVQLELNIIQSVSGIEQRRNINNFCLN